MSSYMPSLITYNAYNIIVAILILQLLIKYYKIFFDFFLDIINKSLGLIQVLIKKNFKFVKFDKKCCLTF